MQPQGTILLTGPAGSGKTTTMYAALGYLRENKKNLRASRRSRTRSNTICRS